MSNIENNLTEISIYPNPTPGTVIVSYSGKIDGDIELLLINVLGEVIYQEVIYQTGDLITRTLDIGINAKGIYYLQIKEENIKTVKKIVLN
ncbi:MAG: T9SS type A sorting domain-containing protein [Bacteroidota bacterium]|nr:T9SS type A sorting domain-containing protein [Bacteroidota bacterium]